MRKIWKRILICICVTAIAWGMQLFSDHRKLREELIRFHVVANSDTAEDQEVKLKVRDAVLESIRSDLQNVTDIGEARAYLQENLSKIRQIADQTLQNCGFAQRAEVALCREAFDTRIYDTFTLPAGTYEALRITIGEGQGHNWWCVAFPALCMPAAGEDFADTAAGAGFSPVLSRTLADRESYRIRFFLLDTLGQLENNLFADK